MHYASGQGAIDSTASTDLSSQRQMVHLRCGASRSAGTLRGQGATEYLVLLAVVLVIALVGIALLGFFPGTASDAQISESKIYWQSATPIAITDIGGMFLSGANQTYPYYFIRNTGSYPIRITGIIGGDGGKATRFYTETASGCSPPQGYYNIADYYYMAPGEEKYFASSSWHGGSLCRRHTPFWTGATGTTVVGGAAAACQNSTTAPGVMVFNSFGFEYIQYVEGQEITKRQIGTKPLIFKCRERI